MTWRSFAIFSRHQRLTRFIIEDFGKEEAWVCVRYNLNYVLQHRIRDSRKGGDKSDALGGGQVPSARQKKLG